MGEVNHIEIDKNAVEELGKIWENLLGAKEGIKESFNKAMRSMHNMSGGLGNTAESAEQLQSRMAQVEELAELMIKMPGINIQRFIKNVDNADMRAALLRADIKRIRAERVINLTEEISAYPQAERGKLLDMIEDADIRRGVEESIRRKEEEAKAKEKEKDTSLWDKFAEAYDKSYVPYDYMMYGETRPDGDEKAMEYVREKTDGVFRDFGHWWENTDSILAKAGVLTGAVAAIALLLYATRGKILKIGLKTALPQMAKGATIFGTTGAVFSAGATAVQGGSGSDVVKNALIGGGLGVVGGGLWGWGFAAESGALMFTSGFTTSVGGSAIHAYRDGTDFDAELFARIYAKSVISGALDMSLGKALSVKPDPVKFNVSYPMPDSEILKNLGIHQRITRIDKFILPFGEHFQTGTGGFLTKINVSKGFIRGDKLYFTVTQENILSPELKFLLSGLKDSTLPSTGSVIGRGAVNNDPTDIILDTFYVPTVKK